jgi:hypothetical protein
VYSFECWTAGAGLLGRLGLALTIPVRIKVQYPPVCDNCTPVICASVPRKWWTCRSTTMDPRKIALLSPKAPSLQGNWANSIIGTQDPMTSTQTWNRFTSSLVRGRDELNNKMRRQARNDVVPHRDLEGTGCTGTLDIRYTRHKQKLEVKASM